MTGEGRIEAASVALATVAFYVALLPLWGVADRVLLAPALEGRIRFYPLVVNGAFVALSSLLALVFVRRGHAAVRFLAFALSATLLAAASLFVLLYLVPPLPFGAATVLGLLLLAASYLLPALVLYRKRAARLRDRAAE